MHPVQKALIAEQAAQYPEIGFIGSEVFENGVARLRVLISTAVAAAKLLETGELETRIATLEQAIGVGRQASQDQFADDPI